MFTAAQASSIGIIGGADGPHRHLCDHPFGPRAAGPHRRGCLLLHGAGSRDPAPIMKLLTTKAERRIIMKPLRQVSRKRRSSSHRHHRLCLPAGALCAPLVACLMLGVAVLGDRRGGSPEQDRPERTVNIVHHLPGHLRGLHRHRQHLPVPKTLVILAMGIVAFAFGTMRAACSSPRS